MPRGSRDAVAAAVGAVAGDWCRAAPPVNRIGRRCASPDERDAEPLPLRVATAADDADRAVLVRVAAGELDALDELYERYKTMAYSIAYRITNDATLAEDVVQDAFLGAWRDAARYVEGRGSVKTWLLSIVHHRAIDAMRRRRPTTELPEEDGGATGRAATPDVWAEVSAGLDAETVRGALDGCPTSSARPSSSPTSAG